MRKTKIVCTLGPSTDNDEVLKGIMKNGMDVARFNFSHGTHEEHKGRLDKVKKFRKELGLPIAAMLDTKGPEVRVRDFEDGKIMLENGNKFTLTIRDLMGNSEIASVTYKELPKDVEVGTRILIDDGLIELKVLEVTDTDVVCEVICGGPVSNHKGVNIPNVDLSMPYISDVDRSDIIFGIEQGFDFIAASFVRSAEVIREIRKLLNDNGGKDIGIIAKIENAEGVENIDSIIEASDGIMVARGDMGVEIPLEEVPVLQKQMIKKAVAQGKHVITATQMLESMITNPRPTRAETADVANAIYDGTTAIMLSGESAAGAYPIEAVKTMARIAERTEQDIDYKSRLKKVEDEDDTDITTAISHACCTTAMDLNASAIITVTMSGFTAGMISRYKPGCPIIGCSVNPRVCRQLSLSWGVAPLLIEKEDKADVLFEEATRAAEKAGYIKKGDIVVLTAGVPLGISGRTNMIRVIEV